MRYFPAFLLALAACSAPPPPEEEAAQLYRTAAQTRDSRTAVGLLDRAIRVHPLMDYFVTRGMLHQTLGEGEAALEDYATALRMGADDPLTAAPRARVHLNRGLLYLGARRWDEAEYDFSQAIHLAPEYTEAYLERAEVRRHRDRPAEAEQDLVLARRLGAGNAAGFYNEGVRSVDQGDVNEAERMFRFALELDPDHALAHVGMARLYMQRRQFAEAAAEFDRAIPARPLDHELYYHRGTSLLESGQPEKALADFAKAVELSAQPSYLAARGMAFHRVRRDEEKAKADLAQALRIDPQCYQAWLNSGVRHQELGELDAAEHDLRRALALRATAEGTLALGRVLQDQKAYDVALDLYRRSLEFYKDEDVRQILRAEAERTRRAKESSP